ncbi:MAG: nucleotide exchange factor GrpE [Gemmatimonadales bacterium]
MSKRKGKQNKTKATADPVTRPQPEVEVECAEPNDAAGVPGGAVAGLVERPEEAVQRLTEELNEQKDKYLRIAAEFDNFRKRVARERDEIRARGQAAVVSSILDSLDDLQRVAALDPDGASTEDVVSGVELVERKLLRELENAGLTRVGAEGDVFDPNHHEAISTAPAPDGDKENRVAAVFQVGYRFGGLLLRPARVQVFVSQEDEEGEE